MQPALGQFDGEHVGLKEGDRLADGPMQRPRVEVGNRAEPRRDLRRRHLRLGEERGIGLGGNVGLHR